MTSVRCLISRIQPKYFSLNSSAYLSSLITRCLLIDEVYSPRYPAERGYAAFSSAVSGPVDALGRPGSRVAARPSIGDSLRSPRPCDLLACQLASRPEDHGQVSIIMSVLIDVS